MGDQKRQCYICIYICNYTFVYVMYVNNIRTIHMDQHSVVQPHQLQCPPRPCGGSCDTGGSISSSGGTSTIIRSTSIASSIRTTSTSSSTTSSMTSRAHLLFLSMMYKVSGEG